MTAIFDLPPNGRHSQNGRRPRMVAHRGTTVFAPENTAASFAYAGERHAWAIETDLRRTKDGAIVCCHNDTVDAAFDGTGKIAEMTLSECRALTAKHERFGGQFPPETLRMPTFGEYLDLCERFGSIPFIEIKDDVVKEAVDELRKRGLERYAVLSGCALRHLVEARSYSDELFLHHIFTTDEAAGVMAQLGNAGVAYNYPDPAKAPAGLVEKVHGMGLKLCLRAGDTPEAVRFMLDMGLDYIPSNRIFG